MFTNLSQNPLLLIILASIGLGISIPIIGSFLIVQRKSGLVDSLSHISMLGAGLGVWLGINPYIFAVILSIFVTLSIFEFGQKIPYKEAILSVFTGFSLAFISIIKKLSGIRINLESIFYGNINSINFVDLCLILGITIIVIAVITKWYREFLWITIDEDLAKTQGIDVPKYRVIFNILAGLVFALYIQIFGIVIISILSITPILISNFLVKGFKPKIISSVVIGVVSLLLSVVISYYWIDYSISSVLAMVLISVFGVSYTCKIAKVF